MNPTIVRSLLVLSSAGLLASCATMTPEECRLADWQDIGLRDGLEGETLARLTARREACAEAQVLPNDAAYARGRELGLQTYCRLDNAAPLGARGGRYQGVCPAVVDREFRRRFDIGAQVHRWRGEVGRIDDRIRGQERKLRDADRDEEKALREAKGDDERRRIRRDFDDRRSRTRDALRDLDRDLRRAREQLRAAEWDMAQIR